jgi:hypothetical protein
VKIYSKSSASILTAVLLVTLGASAAQAGVNVSDVELDFSNGGIDVGAGAGDGDSFQYDDVVPGSATQVNALVTVSDFVNVETVTFVDENDHSGNKPIDFQFYDVSDGEATITVEFFDGDAADDGYTTPISLDNLSVTVKDIDVYQSIEVISPDSYELSESPASVLQVTEDTDAGTTTFAETDGDSYGDADEEVWAVLTYDSTSEFSLRGYVYLGGSFTIEFKATAYTTPTPYKIANGDSLYVLDEEGDGLFRLQADGQSTEVFGELELMNGEDVEVTNPDIYAAYLDSETRTIYFVENDSFGLYTLDFDTGETQFVAIIDSTDEDHPWDNIDNAYGLAKLGGQFILLLQDTSEIYGNYYIADIDIETGELSNFREILDTEVNDAYGLAVLESSGDIFIVTYYREVAYLIDVIPYETDVLATLNDSYSSYATYDTAVDRNDTIWFQGVDEDESALFAYNPNDDQGAVFQGTIRQKGYEALDPESTWGVGVTLVFHGDRNQDSTTQSSCESTGVFLTVSGGVSDRTASSPIVYGACGLSAGAPYSLTVEPMGSVGAKRMLGSGAIPSSGALERTTHLPVLDAGNYKVVLTSRNAAGRVLTLTNHVSVSGDQKYGSISAESLQPHLR